MQAHLATLIAAHRHAAAAAAPAAHGSAGFSLYHGTGSTLFGLLIIFLVVVVMPVAVVIDRRSKARRAN